MNLSRFIQICGLPLFALIAVLSLVLTIVAVLLVVKAKRDFLLSAFLPLCFLPLMLASATSLFSFLSSIEIQLNDNEDAFRDPGLLLTMNLVPVFFGATASFLPAVVTMLGRWSLAWQASGIKLLPERQNRESDGGGIDPDAWVSKEADDYIEQLVRPR
ncbi:MAG: hypothetical protein KDB00_28875 [Planctomycetales bacterium]|nr:hypothetical protein [Planctomycetales bacterium]